MQGDWALGLSAAKVILTATGMVCAGLALFVHLTVSQQLSKFLKELNKTFVRKDVHEAELRAMESRIAAGNRRAW